MSRITWDPSTPRSYGPPMTNDRISWVPGFLDVTLVLNPFPDPVAPLYKLNWVLAPDIRTVPMVPGDEKTLLVVASDCLVGLPFAVDWGAGRAKTGSDTILGGPAFVTLGYLTWCIGRHVLLVNRADVADAVSGPIPRGDWFRLVTCAFLFAEKFRPTEDSR